MQTKKYNNGQRSPPPVPKTGSDLQGTIKAVLGCQKTNGINPRSAIRPQQLISLDSCLSDRNTKDSTELCQEFPALNLLLILL